uniref:Uncharacterized protein n=1 Tax=Siphoviridae sp. ctXQq5 TaxID=2826368 RepID=A0A8S5N0Q6_9CAUD|nr:MAG TPA: hypothetical protein [Siphoviridae sp. ctXQq5]
MNNNIEQRLQRLERRNQALIICIIILSITMLIMRLKLL